MATGGARKEELQPTRLAPLNQLELSCLGFLEPDTLRGDLSLEQSSRLAGTKLHQVDAGHQVLNVIGCFLEVG